MPGRLVLSLVALLVASGCRGSDSVESDVFSAEQLSELIARVETVASPDIKAKCLELVKGKAKWFSQAGQDWYLFHNIFKYNMETIKNGFYIDLGANDPLYISNTFFFDRCLGWQGLCVEPNPQYHEKYANRTCTLVKKCVSDKEEKVKMNWYGTDSTITEDGQGDATCTTLPKLLELTGRHHVDLVSLDIEGFEVKLLQCLDFSKNSITAWAVETNKHDARLMDLIFFRNGYYKFDELLCPVSFAAGSNKKVGHALDSLYVRHKRMPLLPQDETNQFVRHFRSEYGQDGALKCQSV